MTRLVASEIRRLTSRRLVRRLALLSLVLIAAGGALAFVRTDSLSEATFQQRQAEADQRQAAQDAEISSCLTEHGVARQDEVPDEVARDCFTDPAPAPHDPRFHRTRLLGILQGTAGVLVLVGWLIGASMVGAEFASRSMTTTLTWEPRRLRVIVAKAGVAIAGAALLAAGIVAATTLAMLPALLRSGAPVTAAEPSWATLLGAGLRGTALPAISCGIGFGIATLARNTGAALGAGFVYVVVIENILGSSLAAWRPWLLLGNLIVFVSGHADADIPGRSVAEAALFLSLVALAALIAGALSFRARDVA